jgi:hypothetical protein
LLTIWAVALLVSAFSRSTSRKMMSRLVVPNFHLSFPHSLPPDAHSCGFVTFLLLASVTRHLCLINSVFTQSWSSSRIHLLYRVLFHSFSFFGGT